MSDPFGILAGAVGIAAAFTACVDCFEYIQFGRHFKRDFQTDYIILECARLRLTRWGQAVNVYNDPRLGQLDANHQEFQLASEILHQVLVLFANTKAKSEKYCAETKPENQLDLMGRNDLNPFIAEISNKIKRLAIRRRGNNTGVLKTACWALYDRSEFNDLIKGITALLDNLESLFPAARYQRAAEDEVRSIVDEQALVSIQNAAQGVDPLLQKVTTNALGHRYSNLKIYGKAQAGDKFTKDWEDQKGITRRRSHAYDGVEVGKDGKALIGNQYGGKDFWDE